MNKYQFPFICTDSSLLIPMKFVYFKGKLDSILVLKYKVINNHIQ